MSIFEVGKGYSMVNLIVTKRTAKTVTLCGEWDGAEPVTKRINVTSDGVEWVKVNLPMGVWANDPYESPEQRQIRINQRKAMEKEKARLERIAYDVPEHIKLHVETIETDVIVAWALGNDIPNLVKYARRIETGSGIICADPSRNHCFKELYFNCGVEVWIYDGVNDKFTSHIYANAFNARRDKFDDAFTMHPTYHPEYGETLTKEGKRIRSDGTEWTPNYESLNY